ncbi:MAG: glycosyltransferase [Oscillospiraceae bacterium]
MKQIICLSHTPWSSRPTRTQQLMTRLAGADVLFFEPPGPKPDGKGRKVRPNVMVYQLPKMIDLASHTTLVGRHNRRKIAACVEKAMARHRFREPLLWCTTPENIHQLDYLAYRGLVYDCHRYWSDLPVAWEGELAAAADVCFAASDGLVDRLSPCNENIALLPNGVNYPLFCRELLDTPQELADLAGRPVLGFVGSLRADLDVSPLLLAADRHPDWTILLIGPVEPSAYLSQLEQRENIRLLGKRPLVDLPDYLGCCGVCVHLLRTLDEDSDVIPARVYEYLAAGKPVVSMLWKHQREEFPDVIRPARTAEEFVVQCEQALAEDPAGLLRRRRDYGAAAAWDVRAEEVTRILEANGLF